MKHSKITLFCYIVLSVAFALSTTGCGAKEVEQTNDQLKVAYYGSDDAIAYALYEFGQQHPEVEVITDSEAYGVSDDQGEAFYKRIAAEMMGGNGPDVLVFNCTWVNANKMMRSGAFEDMNRFVENDPDWDFSDLNQTVLKAGQVDGKQYVMPLTYSIPLILTTQSLLDGTDFDISTADNYIRFMEECLRYKESSQNPELIFRAPLLTMRPYAYYLSIQSVDFDKKKASVAMPEIREAVDLYQQAVVSQYFVDGLGEFTGGGVYGAIALKEKTALFQYSNEPLDGHIEDRRALKGIGETPVSFPLYNIDEQLSAEITTAFAINANSPNKQNAYELIKLALNETNYGYQAYKGDIFIVDSAVRSYLEGLIGKDEALSLYSGDSGGIETLAGLTQADVDEYMSFLDKIDIAYLPENDVVEVCRDEIKPYLEGAKSDLDDCLDTAEEKLNRILSE